MCKLRRKTVASVVLKFTPGKLFINQTLFTNCHNTKNVSTFTEKDIKKLVTSVQAKILELPLPFPGVDGTSACNNVYEADGETKTSCPLKAGTPYVYKNSFEILEIYPQLSLVVHWALTSNNKDVVCFELPARIV